MTFIGSGVLSRSFILQVLNVVKRRTFISSSAAAGSSLIIGIYLPGCQIDDPGPKKSHQFNVYSGISTASRSESALGNYQSAIS